MNASRTSSAISSRQAQVLARGTLGYSRWDCVPSFVPESLSRRSDEEAVRYERRVAIVERAIQSGKEADRHALHTAMCGRARDLSNNAQSMIRGNSRYVHPARIFFMKYSWVLFIAIILVRSIPQRKWMEAFYIIGMWFMLWAVGFAWHMRKTPKSTSLSARPLLDAYQLGLCPDCDYDLNAVPDELEHTLIEGTRIGPRVCPECGSKWPRVPIEWKPGIDVNIHNQ